MACRWVLSLMRKSRVWGCEIFVKCFTLVFLVKYFTSFYTQSFSERKIFCNFDYILHAIKRLKMGKYFIENILHQNKRSVRKRKLKNITFEKPLASKNLMNKLVYIMQITYNTWITLKVQPKQPPKSLKTLLNRTYNQPWKLLNILYKI